MLARLPEDKFARRVRGASVTCVYADPKLCNCLYAGSQDAYGRYQSAVQAKRTGDQLDIAVEDFADRASDWGAWGSWGPHWGAIASVGRARKAAAKRGGRL